MKTEVINRINLLKEFQSVPVEEYPSEKVINPVVSVLVQTYQHSRFIRECLDGILMQKTNFIYEILLGDDQSFDGTREICIEYAKKYADRIRLFLHSRENNIAINGNPTGRFNFFYNWLSARGKYIAFCEGDDYWTDPLKLQKQVDFLNDNPDYSGCIHETQKALFPQNIKEKIYGSNAPLKITTVDTISAYAIFHTSSLVFRKEAISELPHWKDQVLSLDMALLSIISSYGPVRKIPQIMSVYRKHESGITNLNANTLTFHQNRIKLISYLDEYHMYRYHQKCEEIITFHKQCLTKDDDIQEKKQMFFSIQIFRLKSLVKESIKSLLK